MEEEKAAKTLEVEKLEKKVQEAEEYQHHMEQEQSDGQVLVEKDYSKRLQGVLYMMKAKY